VRRALRLAAALALAGLLITRLDPGRTELGGTLSQGLGGAASAVAAGAAPQPPTAGDAFTPELEPPATEVVAFGASPQQTPGEAWAYGNLGSAPASVEGHEYSGQPVLLEHTDASGWQVVPLPPGKQGKPLSGTGGGEGPARYGALAGQATPAGGVVLLSGQDIVARDPDGRPRLLSPEAIDSPGAGSGSGPGAGEVLGPRESLLPPPEASGFGTIPYAAIEESSDLTGMLIAPYGDGRSSSAGSVALPPGVLHYDGSGWTREPIAIPSGMETAFTPQALACGGTAGAPISSSPSNCWLLASASTSPGGNAATTLLLFRREPSGEPPGYAWEPQPISDWLLGGERAPGGVTQHAVAPLAQGAQMLTVTAQGAWIDFQATINGEPTAVDVSELVTPGSPTGSVVGTWCYSEKPDLTALVCPEHTLGAMLPARYRSFAWSPPPGSPAGNAGTRIVTGLENHVMLELAEGGGFSLTNGAGGGAAGTAPGGAAFTSPAQGWIADGEPPTDEGADGEGQSQVIELGSQPGSDQLGEEAVPFRRPLLALAQAPGSTPGDPGAEAIAVGVDGQIGRYVPGQGWRPEALYNAEGLAATNTTLRGVAWPEPTRAYAVGDNGTMWLWRAETGLWETDPAKPFNFIGNLTAIEFEPGEPQVGYAVGKQGVVLRYGKSWEQVPLPPELQQANFISVTFAGSVALAVYRKLEGGDEIGGVAIEDGAGWQVDQAVAALLDRLPSPGDRVLTKIAGLSDGGAVAAGPGLVIECDSECGSPTASWHFASEPLPQAQNISALAAYREGSADGPVRAVVSIDLDRRLNPETFDGNLIEGPYAEDVPAPTGAGQPPPFIGSDPLPNSGYVLKETAAGWVDMEHEALPANLGQPSDQPIRPDPVLALIVAPTGESGLAVGGQTDNATGTANGSATGAANGSGTPETEAQTAAAMRLPAAAASTNGATPSAIAPPAGQASFAIGGQAACVLTCAAFTNESLGPEVWLRHALASANQIATGSSGGLRAFLYTGGGEEVFSRELANYGERLPVYGPESGATAPGAIGGPNGAYRFSSEGSGGKVEVIVLDGATGVSAQLPWLEEELKDAGGPAIVLGNAPPSEPLSRILLSKGASAYFYDSPGANVKTQIGSNEEGAPVWAYGTGTLGYTEQGGEPNDSLAATSGFLRASVNVAARKKDNVAPVEVKAVPNIAQLALDATDGLLVRRSHVALFEGLARRPPAGGEAAGETGHGAEIALPDPYDQIPFDCQGHNCPYEIPTEYTFTSSNPDIGGFVAHEPGSVEPLQVELGADKLPVPDEPRNARGALLPGGRFAENAKGEPVNEKGEVVAGDQSGIFCAYNPGTTIVSIVTGGLIYSEPVTVQGGSVEYPCGTVPLKSPPALAVPTSSAAAIPGLSPSNPPPASPKVRAIPPPPPPQPASLTPPLAVRHPPSAPIPFTPLVPPPAVALPAVVLPIGPPLARPIPPSGTSPVYQPMVAPERQRERETAEELASNDFSAYYPGEGDRLTLWIVPLAIVAAGAGVGIRRGVGSARHRPAFARARVDRRSPR
jgi:hypothetical protein